MAVDREQESYADLEPKLIGGERLQVARTGVSELEDIIMEIGDFAQALKVCASAEDDMPPCVPRLIGTHLARLSENAEQVRAKLFHAIYPPRFDPKVRS